MTGHAITPRSRTTLTGTWLLAMVLVLAPALSDVCAAMCAMPMPAASMRMAMPAPTPAPGGGHTNHREHKTDAANAAAHHDHCGAVTATVTSANDVPASPFVVQATHQCVLHGSTAPSSADEMRTLAARGGATDESRGALDAPPAVAALTFSLAASARSAPLSAPAFTSGLASARPLRVPLRI